MSPRSVNGGLMPATAIVPSVLVADADDDTRALYCDVLAAAGYRVIEASDGRDALAKALVEPPTLIVTEATLPLVSGYALCEIVRRDPATATVPVLVITADSRAVQGLHAKRAGADHVLVKPVDIDIVLKEVRRLIEKAADGPAAAADAPPTAAAPGRTGHGRSLSKSWVRFTTTTPPISPLPFVCPGCDRPLTYGRSHVGGVTERQREQWDEYLCGNCGVFQYRHRTRKLRPMPPER